MSRNNNNGLVTAGGIATGLGLLAGLGYVAYELYQQFNEQEQQQQQRANRRGIPIIPSRPKVCSICDDRHDSSLFKLQCGHIFHSQCLSANYALKSIENPGVSYKCLICHSAVSPSDILVFTHRKLESFINALPAIPPSLLQIFLYLIIIIMNKFFLIVFSSFCFIFCYYYLFKYNESDLKSDIILITQYSS